MITIEDTPVNKRPAGRNHDEFWATVKKLQPGQSFLYDRVDSNLRNGLRIAEHLLDIQVSVKKEGDQQRVGRIR